MRIITLFFTLLSFTLFAQKAPVIKGKILHNKYSNIELKIAYKVDSVVYGKATVDKDGNFLLNTTITKPDLYRLVLSEKDFFLFVLQPGENIEVTFDSENLQSIVSVSGSSNMTFVKKAADMIYGSKMFLDSLNTTLQADPTQLYFNQLFQDFHQYHQTNQDVDRYMATLYNTYDSLTQYIQNNSENGKIKSKELDQVLAVLVPYLKNIESSYLPLRNYLNNAPSFYNFSSNRVQNAADFYKMLDESYINKVNNRHQFVKKSFQPIIDEVVRLNKTRDSLVFNELMGNTKIKKAFVEDILNVIKKYPVKLEELNIYKTDADNTDKMAITIKEECQNRVKAVIQKYQTYYNNENVTRDKNLRDLILSNKENLAVLMFIDMYPREQNMEFHQEIIKALNAKYPDNPLVMERQKVESAPKNPTAIGAMAPEIELPNPDGKILKLSDLRGKVVLIDFWAAWCRPCRMENPNVVKDYHKYNEKGFEVFSVSLDRDKASWTKAIQDDGLVWPNHVSDLKYWSSQAAATYGVTSIPATFLIGKDGRIIAKNLRGEALGQALEELLGK